MIAIEDLTRTPFDQLLALMLEDDDLQPIAIDDFATTPSHVVDGFSSRYPDRVIRPRRFNGVYSGGLGINLAQLPALARLIKVALEEPETSVMLECQRLADNSLIPFAGTGLRLKYYRGVQFGVHGGNFNGHAAYMVAIPSHKFVGILWGSRIGLRSLRTTLERVVRKVIDSTITTEDARPPLSMHAGFRIDRRQSGYSYALVARHVVGKGVNVDLERGEGYLSSPHGWFDGSSDFSGV